MFFKLFLLKALVLFEFFFCALEIIMKVCRLFDVGITTCCNDFDAGKSISRAIGKGGPRKK
jgi:hypothetical protein